MLGRILKNDLLKRKTVNGILFLFITLATIFLASSVNNILIIGKGVDFYLDYANVPDVNLLLSSLQEKDAISNWLETQKDTQVIDDFAYSNLLTVSEKLIEVKHENESRGIEGNGVNLYLAKNDIKFSKVFDEEGQEIHLNKGEIGLPIAFMEKNNISIGDFLVIKIGELEQTFLVKKRMKDATFGSEMVGMYRFVIPTEDYDYFSNQASKMGLFFIKTSDGNEFTEKLNQQSYSSIVNNISKDTYKLVYSFDMIMAALLILIGVCLILIALLVLRFTIIFTMEEQYQEIGILKAIGFKNFSIKQIYLLKYFTIVFIGATLGFFISIPVSSLMIQSVSKNMIMAESNVNISVNLLCSIFIIGLILCFCYFCTRKLNKVSPIQAIRNGSSGERFTKRSGLSLYLRKKMPVSFYLAVNDILGHLKRYAVLLFTFVISFILITIPMNTLNTMRSDEMLRRFNIDPESAVYVRSIESNGEEKYQNVLDLQKRVFELKEEMAKKNYQVRLTIEPIFFLKYGNLGEENKQTIMTLQFLGDNQNFALYSEGRAPKFQNEVAFSENLMKLNQWQVGDYVETQVNGSFKTLLITGVYSDYMQLGKSARLNPVLSCQHEIMFDYWTILVDMETDLSQEKLAHQLQLEFPDYEWMSGQQFVNQNIGGIQDVLEQLVVPMTFLLCGIIMLITLLMEKLFIARERSELALLKSLGFHHSVIRNYHIIRMLMVAFLSLLLSIPISLLSNQFLLKPIFKIMGANVVIQVNPWLVYLLMPGVLFIGIILATWISTKHIKKIHIRDINNME